MKVTLSHFLFIGLIIQSAIGFSQVVENNTRHRITAMQKDTLQIAILLGNAQAQFDKVGTSKIAADSALNDIALALKINNKVKSDKYSGLIALTQANLYNIQRDYERTVYYAKLAIPFLLKTKAYQELANDYNFFATNLSYDDYQLKIDAIQKAGYYDQKAGNPSGAKSSKDWLNSFEAVHKDYLIENRKAKVLRSGIVPGVADKTQAMLLLKIAEYQILKPLAEPRDLDSARRLIQQAEKINAKIKDPECETTIFVGLADLLIEQRNTRAEIAVIQKGIETLKSKGAGNNFIADLYYRLSQAYSTDDGSLNSKMNAAMTAIRYYQACGQDKKMGDIYFALGNITASKNKYDLASSQYEQALKWYKLANYKELAPVYYALSNIADAEGHMEQTIALELLCEKYITASTPINDQIHWALDLSALYSFSNLPAAIYWGKKVSELSVTAGDFNAFYTSVRFLTTIFRKSNQSPLALKRLQQAIKNYPPQNIGQERDADEAFGECLASLHQYAKAKQYMIKYEKSLKNYTDEHPLGTSDYYQNYTTCLCYLTRFYYTINEPLKAQNYLRKMNAIVAKTTTIAPEMRFAMEDLEIKIDIALKHSNLALLHYEHYNKLKDSLFNNSRTRDIEELNIKYATQARIKDIKLLENRNEIQRAQLKQITLQKNLVIAGIILILLFSSFVFYNYRQKQHTNRELQSQQKMINQQNAALEGLVNQKDELLQDKETLLREKELLMLEIHHRIKNNLHMISSLLESQSAYLEDEALLAIQKGQHRIQAISLVHQKLYANTDGMEVAMDVYLRELITYLRESVVTDQNIVFDVDLDPISLSGGQAMPLGLIVNESVTNAIKYAFGDRHLGHIGISLKQETDNYISLSIFDDGVGLPPDHEENTKASSMGMKLIKGLAKTIGGEATIQSAPGTTIDLRFKKIELFNFDPDQKEYPSVNTGVS